MAVSRKKKSFQDYIHHDHIQIMALLTVYGDTRPQDPGEAEVRRVWETFSASLRRHIRWEDEIFFPIFEDHTTQHLANPTASLRQDHQEALQMLEAIGQELRQGARNTATEDRLRKVLTAHTFKEEHLIYPHIDQHISPAAHRMIQRSMDRIRKDTGPGPARA